MESDLETRWQKAVKEKNLSQGELKATVAEMERGLSVPTDWNRRMIASLTRDRAEVEERYGIKIGQTSISCARCGRPWGFGGHTCQDIRFADLQQKQKDKQEELKDQGENLLNRIREIGAKKLSTISFDGDTGSFISEKAISKWIYKAKIPSRHLDRVSQLLKTV